VKNDQSPDSNCIASIKINRHRKICKCSLQVKDVEQPVVGLATNLELKGAALEKAKAKNGTRVDKLGDSQTNCQLEVEMVTKTTLQIQIKDVGGPPLIPLPRKQESRLHTSRQSRIYARSWNASATNGIR